VALTGTTKPAWKPCCERLCGHDRVMAAVVACGSVSGRGGARAANGEEPKASPEIQQKLAHCWVLSRVLHHAVHTHFSHFTSS
jgi:hypothetical protein